MNTKKIIAFLLATLFLVSAFAFSASAASVTFKPETRNGKIYGIPVGATVSVLKNAYYNVSVQVTNANGISVANSDPIGTGYTVKLNGISHTAVVLGDVNGDATLSATDYITIRRVCAATYTTTNIALEAAGVDVENGEDATTMHYIRVKRAVMGTYDMNMEYNCDPYDPTQDESGWTPGWV
ncbi:MAG: hypothetical protein IKC39_00500 [Clostridia bacterium]|nr:hypothetical protein [Clostridia bacterium]